MLPVLGVVRRATTVTTRHNAEGSRRLMAFLHAKTFTPHMCVLEGHTLLCGVPARSGRRALCAHVSQICISHGANRLHVALLNLLQHHGEEGHRQEGRQVCVNIATVRLPAAHHSRPGLHAARVYQVPVRALQGCLSLAMECRLHSIM